MSSGLEIPTGSDEPGYNKNSKPKSSSFGSFESFLDVEKTRIFLMERKEQSLAPSRNMKLWGTA